MIRDNKYFMLPFFMIAYRGKNIDDAMNFKNKVYHFTGKQYQDYYLSLDIIKGNRPTDLSEASLTKILSQIDPSSNNLLDVGCGRGYFLNRVKALFPDLALYGCDLYHHLKCENYHYNKANIEKLPYPNDHFDIVCCSHTLEHIIDLKQAISELLRITRKKLIIVVPRQRYYYYTLDTHVNFFPYQAGLISLFPKLTPHCELVEGDWILVLEK
jgi:ubiquinone/menaquinone biosynthesis C-methylase UbiE